MDRQETKKIQAVAIFFMMWHHLFGCGTFLTLETNLWGGGVNKPLITAIGSSMKLCVAVYLLCSGYGLYRSYINKAITPKKSNFWRIFSFLLGYWLVVFLVAVPYLYYMGKLEWKYLFINLFALLHNDQILYVSFSWYVKLYLLILLIIPVMRWIDKKPSKRSAIIEILLYVILPFLLSYLFRGFLNEETYDGLMSFVASSVIFVLSYFPIFYAGVFLSKYMVIEHAKELYKKLNKWVGALSCIGVMVAVLWARRHIYISGSDLIYSTVFVVCCSILLESVKLPIIHRLLTFLGKYSFWYWMLSGMFFLNTSELQWILFIPYYWLAIIVWTFLILTPPAMLLEKLKVFILDITGNVLKRR